MTSRSSHACCPFLPIGVAPIASMVVMEWPTAALTGVTQDRRGMPSKCTVHAPHRATPQPNLVPFMPSTSRNTHSSGMSGGTSTLWDFPLILSVTIVLASRYCARFVRIARNRFLVSSGIASLVPRRSTEMPEQNPQQMLHPIPNHHQHLPNSH